MSAIVGSDTSDLSQHEMLWSPHALKSQGAQISRVYLAVIATSATCVVVARHTHTYIYIGNNEIYIVNSKGHLTHRKGDGKFAGYQFPIVGPLMTFWVEDEKPIT